MFFRKRADNTNTTVIPAPKVLQPTTEFDGNDGSWSTFFINIGGDGQNANVGQNFKVLPSTSSPITLVPGVSSWCDSACAKQRGVEIFAAQQPLGFEAGSSKSWQEKGIFNIPLAEDLQLYPDASPNGTWGTDNVGLGQAGGASLVLQGQWVVQSTSRDFYMGTFGLAALPVNAGGENRPTFLANFRGFNNTATNSYGYTAGASYRNNSKGVLGSLVLGGYDQSRFTDQNITIPFINAGNNSLIVGVQSITYHPDQDIDTNVLSFTSNRPQFSATIDSTLPYLWLPDDICDQFAQTFQLTYDKTRNMYTVNETAHNNNQRLNATMVFQINPGINTDGSVSITLPYAAFDLQASDPIFINSTRYFPIKQSPTGEFVLGRSLLQEAYLIVDYERNQFQLAPANYSDPMPQEHLVTIFPKGYSPPSSSNGGNSDNNNDGGGGGLSSGAIAGIAVGIVAVALLAALGFFFWWKKRRQQKRASEKEAPQEIDTIAAGAEVKKPHMSELDSEPPTSPKPSMGGYYGTEGKDISPFPPINEMESPPAELYSPPPPGDTPRSDRSDYFITPKPRRRGATRESSGNNTPGTPGAIYELPGNDGAFQVGGQNSERVGSPTLPVHSRGPSDTSLNTNIDEVIADSRGPSQAPPDRRPSHSRGISDAPTVQSDSTAVSDPTPEERERWAEDLDGPRRPLSE